MNLIVAATNKEISPFLSVPELRQNSKAFVAGVGCLETGLNLTRFLSLNGDNISRIINVGIAGAFQNSGAELLAICVARREILADFGICYDDRIENLGFPGCPENSIMLSDDCFDDITLFFEKENITVANGTFLTVNCVSGTGRRGDYLQKKHQALCESMEGFAVARVCQEFKIPCLEVRCISNFVEDRNPHNWVIDQACAKLGSTLIPFLQ